MNQLSGGEAAVLMLKAHGVKLSSARAANSRRSCALVCRSPSWYSPTPATLVDVIAQPLQEAKAPVSEWVA